MNDLIGKNVKIYFNSHTGYLCMVGKFVKADGAFIVIIDAVTKKLSYISLYSVKNIEIVGE